MLNKTTFFHQHRQGNKSKYTENKPKGTMHTTF